MCLVFSSVFSTSFYYDRYWATCREYKTEKIKWTPKSHLYNLMKKTDRQQAISKNMIKVLVIIPLDIRGKKCPQINWMKEWLTYRLKGPKVLVIAKTLELRIFWLCLILIILLLKQCHMLPEPWARDSLTSGSLKEPASTTHPKRKWGRGGVMVK